jgi:hypothetical protein
MFSHDIIFHRGLPDLQPIAKLDLAPNINTSQLMKFVFFLRSPDSLSGYIGKLLCHSLFAKKKKPSF